MGMILPFTPLFMCSYSTNYFVDMPSEIKVPGVTEDRLQLLQGVTGAFRPGVLTALMGRISGAGQITLMDDRAFYRNFWVRQESSTFVGKWDGPLFEATSI